MGFESAGLTALNKLHKFKTLETLHVFLNAEVGLDGLVTWAEMLGAKLQDLPSLTDLSVGCSRSIFDAIMDQLLQTGHIVWKLPQLRKLGIRGVFPLRVVAPKLEDLLAKASTIRQTVPTLTQFTALRKLDLCAMPCYQDCCDTLAERLAAGQWSWLTELGFRHRHKDCVLAVMRALSNRPCGENNVAPIEKLTFGLIHRCKMGRHEVCLAMQDMLHNQRFLEELVFVINTTEGERLIMESPLLLTPALLPKLRKMSLSFADEGLFQSIHCPSLRSLELTTPGVCLQSLDCVAQSCPGLQALSLS